MTRSARVVLASVGLAGLFGGAIVVYATRAFVARPAATTAVEEEEARAERSDEATQGTPEAATPARTQDVAPAPAGERGPAEGLLDRWLTLLEAGGSQDELAALERELTALGESAAPALVARIDARAHAPGVRDRLFNLLRGLPGAAAEERLATEARAGTQSSTRTLAMEALAARRTDRAMNTLVEIARHDATLPTKSLITAPRGPDDTGTELPDEVEFTPRMQAMNALAGTKDPRATALLVEVTRGGPDEALRMEAARQLGAFRDDARALEALRVAAATDASPYVRLAALHSLSGASDPSLFPVLEQIAAHDRDAGVRLLAGQVLARARD